MIITTERDMPDDPHRKFSLADAMVLVAATAPGLILLRTASDLGLFNLSSNPKSPPGRLFIEYLSTSSGCVLGSLTFAVLVLCLHRPWPNRREVIGRPGFVACAAAAAAAFLPLAYFVVGLTSPTDLGSITPMYFNIMLAQFTHGAGAMIIGAWIALALVGRWQPGPTWKDWLGCVIGACWICIYVCFHLYFIMQPLLRRWTT
jgi:hypothetical protein